MNPNDPNVAMMEFVAERLGTALRERMVFVGGAVAGLLITDPGQPAIRPTEDVDLLVHATLRTDYQDTEAALRAQGFRHDPGRDAPICRWRVGQVAVDVMPTLPEILGFANQWYPHALDNARWQAMPSGLAIRLIDAPSFIATKFEAFADRGRGDYLFSHDLGDLLAVVDGRAELPDECRAVAPPLRAYLGERCGALLAATAFIEALPGHLPGDAASQARLPDLLEKLRQLSALAT